MRSFATLQNLRDTIEHLRMCGEPDHYLLKIRLDDIEAVLRDIDRQLSKGPTT